MLDLSFIVEPVPLFGWLAGIFTVSTRVPCFCIASAAQLYVFWNLWRPSFPISVMWQQALSRAKCLPLLSSLFTSHASSLASESTHRLTLDDVTYL